MRILYNSTFIEECRVVIEKNIDKKLASRFSYQIWYERCLKGKFGRGVQICEGGSKSVVIPARRRCLCNLWGNEQLAMKLPDDSSAKNHRASWYSWYFRQQLAFGLLRELLSLQERSSKALTKGNLRRTYCEGINVMATETNRAAHSWHRFRHRK